MSTAGAAVLRADGKNTLTTAAAASSMREAVYRRSTKFIYIV